MNKLHKILSYLPIFIVINWVVCFVFLRNAYFYKENYYKFDLMDTIMVGISFIHFFFYYKIYTTVQMHYLICILAVIFLTLIYQILNENIYYFFYIFIISVTIITSLCR